LLIISLSTYGKEFTSENGGLNADGQRIYLKGVSWFGFETSLSVFHGLWSVDYNFVFDLLQKNGFNAMRIPFSLDLVLNDPAPKSISFGFCNNNVSCNLDLKGLTSLQVLDRMIQSARDRGIAIMLDMHSFEPDAFAANGLWYDSSHPESMVLKGWAILVDSFGNQSNVFAVDVKNEPFLGTWNTGDATTDWDAACKRIGDHIVGKSNWLVFVEGVSKSPACPDPCFYGGDLKGVLSAPIALSNPKKLVYSPHTYGPNVYPQPYFSDPTFPKNMPAIWDDHFGFIKDKKGPAVVTGEWEVVSLEQMVFGSMLLLTT